MAAQRPPGPDVGEIVDGVAARRRRATLPYRLYRPASPGPHPIVVYFHGGGWVLGNHDSDDPFCRDLCVRTDAIVVSVNYRHAPEAPLPGRRRRRVRRGAWIAAHAVELGGDPGRAGVGGWSAGGNIAAVVCQLARDAGGAGDRRPAAAHAGHRHATSTRASYVENGDGYMLTAALMRWFWDHYADPADRDDPKAAPLRGRSLARPAARAWSSPCEFDPLRDEGMAYAQALAAAGVPVRYIRARGHTHTSLTMVDMVLSGAPVRAEIAEAVRGLFKQRVASAVLTS